MGKGGVKKLAFFCYIICGRPLYVLLDAELSFAPVRFAYITDVLFTHVDEHGSRESIAIMADVLFCLFVRMIQPKR